MDTELGDDPLRRRRRFNVSERAVLYLAADALCEMCGCRLGMGWHADHVEPYVKGGATDVINGQALCPPCNLRKGARVTELRTWQREAMDDFVAKGARDFLVSATPGAGKTMFASTLAKRVLDEGAAERVIVVVPTDSLRQQWADAAAAFGLSLMPVNSPEDYEKPGYHGCVATYAQLARGAGAALVRRTTRIPTFAVLDEIHHAGENRAWGDGLTEALERAVYRLALTGTPWRKNAAEPIPFVRYDSAGKVAVDYAYEYGAALADGVCRGVVFDAYDGSARWVDCGKISEATLGADLADDDVSAVLDAIYTPGNEWAPSILREADAALTEVRLDVPDAAGLVIANTQAHAQAYSRLLAKVSGSQPTVVVSDDPEAKASIDRFRKGTTRWIVAVKMVSEGIDIPRLAVGVYASKARTPLFFRQVVGRFVRTRPGEELTARLFIPAVPALMTHAREIEEELRHQVDLEAARDEKAQAESRGEQREFDLRVPLSASEAVFDRSIFGGGEVTNDERLSAEAACRRRGIPVQYAVQVADMLREVGPVTHTVSVTPVPPAEPRHRRERVLRNDVETLVRKVARREGCEVKEVAIDLLRHNFPKRSQATIEQLELIREYLLARLGGSSG
jgi:superfamily II DNA or RNA helicase